MKIINTTVIIVKKITRHKKTISKIIVLCIIPGGFIILTLWAIKIIYKKPISILDIINVIIEGFDSFPKFQNPIKVFIDSWVFSWVYFLL